MNRRELLTGAAALAAIATAGRAFAAEHDHSMHDHHAMSSRNDKLIAAATDCVTKANLCLQHCLDLLGQGDQTMAACAQSSNQVAAVCAALAKLAASNSKHLPKLARAAMDVCKDCEEECKKTEKHAECKACKEACAACYEECKKIAA
ncbi:MAG: four-helix bundle copper-binding protein [Gammaproteobacteria bacterium]|nr:four-helix bundle copper-binding protein [Gammaproteobacteria bacterium]MBU1967792.1 four-helix bundle copper-binding protein [Gammaproteobacteria bacterium]